MHPSEDTEPAQNNAPTATAVNTTAPRTVKCRVTVERLELHHGTAARNAVIHLPEDVFDRHEAAGRVTFIDYKR